MNCPKCDGTLGPIQVELVELDFCMGCKGSWFDAGEVSAYFELTRDFPKESQGAEEGGRALSCPRCQCSMREVRYASPADLLVDRCEGCGGVFLDRGEIGKLEQLSSQLEHPSKRLEAAAKYLASQGYEVIGVRKT